MTTNAMSLEEIAAELERLRELVTKAEQREEERQRKMRPAIMCIRIVAVLFALFGLGLMVLEQTHGFRGYMGAVGGQFTMLAAVMTLVMSALLPLTGRSNGIAFWRKAAQQNEN